MKIKANQVLSIVDMVEVVGISLRARGGYSRS